MPVAAPNEIENDIQTVAPWERGAGPSTSIADYSPSGEAWSDGLRDHDPADLPPGEPPDDGDDGGGGSDDDDGEPVRWVTVAAFDHPAAAHLARLRVEAEGIDCVLLDENLVATDWLVSNAVGGIKLQVPAPDAARARAMIAPQHVTAEVPAAGRSVECPRCGSASVWPAPLRPAAVLLSVLLLGTPLPFLLIARKARCDGCGLEWR
jgi:hypothetical protein